MLHLTPSGRSSTLMDAPGRARAGMRRSLSSAPKIKPKPPVVARGLRARPLPVVDSPRAVPLRSTRGGPSAPFAASDSGRGGAAAVADETRRFRAGPLRSLARRIFMAAGAPRHIADAVAEILVNADLTGHDSHGVVRIPEYLRA